MTLLDVRIGDLSTARADAIATSTSVNLHVGGGLNAAIHAAAGPELARQTAALGQCAVSEAVTTAAVKLDASYVIHGVAPRWQDGMHGEPALLAALYKAVIREAVQNGCRTLALPSFGTGAYGFPTDVAAEAAYQALTEALVDDWGGASTPLRIVRWWVSSRQTHASYAAAIKRGHRRLRPVRWSDRTFAKSREEPTSATRPLPLKMTIDEDDFDLVRAGLPALEMEEKWWGFWTGTHLRLFRSWTGYEIFSLRARPRPDGRAGAILDQLNVCDDRDRYTASDDAALEEVRHLLKMVMRT
jgi:O-acetyl-ADP-ribose deacetylase (regulator of RNase III)